MAPCYILIGNLLSGISRHLINTLFSLPSFYFPLPIFRLCNKPLLSVGTYGLQTCGLLLLQFCDDAAFHLTLLCRSFSLVHWRAADAFLYHRAASASALRMFQQALSKEWGWWIAVLELVFTKDQQGRGVG